jgi:hypothetical protein
MIMRALAVLSSLCLWGIVLGQSSTSYRLEEFALNAGGHPGGGLALSSASYRMSLDAVGETRTAPELRSAAYSMHVGFALSYPPPREVQQVVLLGDRVTLAWKPERSVGAYHVYRGKLHRLPGDYGDCHIADVPVQQVQVEEIPAVGQGFFYLVTAKSRLFEEGITGYESSGGSRPDPVPCP